MSIRRLSVSAPLSVTDFINVGSDPFALDVVANGVNLSFQGVSVAAGDLCELTGYLMSVVVDPGVPSETILAVFRELKHGPHAIVVPSLEPEFGYPIRWTGSELPGSRTFCARDFARHVIAAIEAANTPDSALRSRFVSERIAYRAIDAATCALSSEGVETGFHAPRENQARLYALALEMIDRREVDMVVFRSEASADEISGAKALIRRDDELEVSLEERFPRQSTAA